MRWQKQILTTQCNDFPRIREAISPKVNVRSPDAPERSKEASEPPSYPISVLSLPCYDWQSRNAYESYR